MFKPLRLVYMETVPEKEPEALTSKNFLGELKKFGYDKEKAKKSICCGGALKEKGGYKLTKAEALVAAGKITTLAELNNAAAYSLDVGDVDDFLDQYGGDKYVKRLFAYGVSKMERDFMAKKQNFESDKKKEGAFEGLKKYATFEDAFNAGFYKEFAVDFDAIMEKGLSVSEYRQRDERFRKLEKKVKKMEQEGGKYPDQKPAEPPKYKEQKAEPPSQDKPKEPPTEPLQTIERTPPKPPESAAEQEKKLKYEKAKYKLSELGKSMRKTDGFMSEMIKKYKENSEAGDIMFGDLKSFEPLGDTSNEDKYLEAFFNKGAIKKDIGASGKKFNDYDDTLYVLRPEILQEFIDGYDELTQKKLDELEHLERVLYNKALGGAGLSQPEKTEEGEIAKAKEEVRKEEEANAIKEIPEIEQVEGYKQSLNSTKAEWRLAARNILPE